MLRIIRFFLALYVVVFHLTQLVRHIDFPIAVLLGIVSVVLVDKSTNKIRATIRPIRTFPNDGTQHVK